MPRSSMAANNEYEGILNTCGCFNLRRMTRAVTQHYDTILAPSSLRATQACILIALATQDNYPMAQLAKRLDLDLSTLSRNLQPLQRDGLITVTSKTMRSKAINLTNKGMDMLNAAAPLWEEAQKTFLQAIGAGNWENMLKNFDSSMSRLKQSA